MSDAAVREQALDPKRSFLVQAPAGSGKTELLVQRYLRLLAGVRYPEQIIAVTFTRKAAAEMRDRVLSMLDAAASGNGAIESHRQLTLRLAQAVLERDRQLDWALLDRPTRLRIDTVDALNGWLAERLPIASGGLADAAVLDEPGRVYRRAAGEMLEDALRDPELRDAAGRVLEALDNSLEALVTAVARVLPMRDQWLSLVAARTDDELRAGLERGLKRLVAARIEALRDVIGPDTARACLDVAETLDGNDGAGADPGEAGPGTDWSSWQRLAAVVLTARGDWRRRFTRREGVPPDKPELKARVTALVEELASRAGARERLVDVSGLPPPVPSPEQIERLLAARSLLTQSVAVLRVLFEREQAVDFLERAIGAQSALGAVDSPSELLLALDRRIEHLLVDEFQDTSHSQFRLLETLTSGWVDGDGRTLFLVGDPMQSIYRFRDADMSLFLRAKATGLGGVRLEPLALSANFRSAPAIVDWVNRVFGAAFPAGAEAAGSPPYAAFEAAQASQADDAVALHRLAGTSLDAQHAVVARTAAAELASDPGRSVAVLVHSRSVLRGLRQALDRHGVPVQAVELDTLAEQSPVQDLLALTRALLHPADRIAWVALLRGPWCGLGWRDIEAICEGSDDVTLDRALESDDVTDRLSGDDARQRVACLRDRIGRGLALRGRYPLAQWIECCWQLIDGPAALGSFDEIDAARRFFSILSGLAVNGDVPDTAELAQAFDVPFSHYAVDDGRPALQIMTIHRAKGLEFDSVILFGLDRRVRAQTPKLIYWHGTGDIDREPSLLMAAMNAGGDPLTAYLRNLDAELDRAEKARLLYVAVTRARRRLHVIAGLPEDAEPAAGSMLGWLAGEFRGLPAVDDPGTTESVAADWRRPVLEALEPDLDAPTGPLASLTAGPAAERAEYEWAGLTAAHVGTVVHRALQRAGDGATLAAIPDRTLSRTLSLLGVPGDELIAATARVRELLARVAADDVGRWILSPRESALSELELAVTAGGAVTHLRIDRTFIDDDGVRWIIDYKTSRHAGGDPETFLDNEIVRYRPQLEAYARAMEQLDSRPTRVGLYFPLLAAFRHWAVEPATAD